MAQPTRRALVRAALRQTNSDLETAVVQLEPHRGQSDVDAMLDMLLQQAQQNKHAIGLFNDKDTDGAIEAMPKRSVVQYVCRQAYELLDDYEDSIDDDMSSLELPKKSEDADDSLEESDEVNDDTPDDTDDSSSESEEPATVTEQDEKPTPKPATARQLRQQKSAPVDDTAKPSLVQQWNGFLADHSLAESATTTGH